MKLRLLIWKTLNFVFVREVLTMNYVAFLVAGVTITAFDLI